MSRELLANNAQTTLSAAITTTGATTLTVTSASAFPATGTFRVLVDSELMSVTGVSGTTFTVTRGVEGTSAATHTSGATISQVITAAGLLAAGAASNAQTAALSSDYTVTGTMANAGLSVSLPEAGTYFLLATVRAGFSLNGAIGNSTFITGRLYDSTNSVAVTNSTSLLVFGLLQIASQEITYIGLGSVGPCLYAVTGAATIQLQAQLTNTSGTVANPQIQSDANGTTSLTAVRLF